jgi:hypothetical protein
VHIRKFLGLFKEKPIEKQNKTTKKADRAL